ncbi:MAG TPA: hypothetical protein VEX68_07890 [Bryobacteraceae bacterium]|nr:hypothetical protein [Bryobacteraceae bacterium]
MDPRREDAREEIQAEQLAIYAHTHATQKTLESRPAADPPPDSSSTSHSVESFDHTGDKPD